MLRILGGLGGLFCLSIGMSAIGEALFPSRPRFAVDPTTGARLTDAEQLAQMRREHRQAAEELDRMQRRIDTLEEKTGAA